MPRDKQIDTEFERYKGTSEFASAQSFTVDPDPGNSDAALYMIFEAGWRAAYARLSAMSDNAVLAVVHAENRKAGR